MKAIVLSVKKGEAALLLEDGTTTYRRMKCRPGERVDVPEQAASVITSMPRITKTVAAAALIVLIGSGAFYELAVPVSYISEDVNPSVEYALNRRDQVLQVAPLNEDAQTVVNDLKVTGDTLTNAVERVRTRLEESDYLNGDDYILFSVVSDSDEHAARLEQELSALLSAEESAGSAVTFSILQASDEDRREAQKHQMSMGRLREMLDIHGKDALENDKLISKYQKMPVQKLFDKRQAEEKKTEITPEPASAGAQSDNSRPASDSPTETAPATENTAAPEAPVKRRKASSTPQANETQQAAPQETEPQEAESQQPDDSPQPPTEPRPAAPAEDPHPAPDDSGNQAQPGGEGSHSSSSGANAPEGNPAPPAPEGAPEQGTTPDNNSAEDSSAPASDGKQKEGSSSDNDPAKNKPASDSDGASKSSKPDAEPDRSGASDDRSAAPDGGSASDHDSMPGSDPGAGRGGAPEGGFGR